MVLPKLFAINDMVSRWSAALAIAPGHRANILDQAALLRECVDELAQHNDLLEKVFSKMDMARFLPWGMRLARILDEFAREGKQPADMPDMEGELSGPAAAIMDTLGAINSLYQRKLEEKRWITTGLEHSRVMSQCDSIPDFFKPDSRRHVIIAGFYILSGSHEKMLKSLWRAGAHVCLHTDAALARGEEPHWSCVGHRSWIKSWDGEAEEYGPIEGGREPVKYNFFSGYDLHSQLERMSDILKKEDDAPTAVILGRNETLMPTLHNLPKRDVNVSMGYPMERAPLFRLLEDMLIMHENRPASDTVVAEDALKVIRHPYLNMLTLKTPDGELVSIANDLRGLDYEIRKGGRNWKMLDVSRQEEIATSRDLVNQCLWHFFHAPGLTATPADFARMVGDICMFLIKYGEHTWRVRYPLDVEIMYRLMNGVLPTLRQNAMANVEFPVAAMRAIFRELSKSVRIPFEADPVEGLQIMGLLESRLLQFDRVIFLDATDDVMPGNEARDPLMPDALRAVYGLPDGDRREKIAAYNVNRLCRGAREVHYLWQEGSGNSEFYDSKKIRSRFVEEPVWREEEKNPALLETRSGPVLTPSSPLHIPSRKPLEIRRSPRLDVSIARFCSLPISPAAIKKYLACPVMFIWTNIMRLSENSPAADSESLFAGKFIHEFMRNFYNDIGPLCDRDKILQNNLDGRVKNIFEKTEKQLNAENMLSFATYVYLKKVFPVRIKEYLENQPERTTILAMEKKCSSRLYINGENVVLAGRLDRIDKRDGKIYVLDYKTGAKMPKNDRDFWLDKEFFHNVEKKLQSKDVGEIANLFDKLRENADDLQLPLYLLMLENSEYVKDGSSLANAGWIPMRLQGKEDWIFGELDEAREKEAINNCRLALALVLAHMRLSPVFTAREINNCAGCPCSSLCFS